MQIPAHLATYPWYAAHCQWVSETYGACAHTPPVGTVAARAKLAGASLADARLDGANLAGAYLADASLADASLAGASLVGADLAGANLRGANLRGANLRGANLAGAYLGGAYLADASLAGAYLGGASDILTIGPIGAERRLLYAVRHTGGPMIQAVCFWGPPVEIRSAIADRCADGTGRESHRAAYLAAIDLIEVWAAQPVAGLAAGV